MNILPWTRARCAFAGNDDIQRRRDDRAAGRDGTCGAARRGCARTEDRRAGRGAYRHILLAQSAKAAGAAQVLITDISTPRLELAKACGVDFAVNTKSTASVKHWKNASGPDKADVIYDCAGNDTTMGQAIRHAQAARSSLWRVCGHGKRGPCGAQRP
ncbi:MAG: zinc-binding dehydrogenase [Ruthenibacterium lactatiformans]